MKASIIIPTFGTQRDYLADALCAVKKQDFSKDEYEILVIDNNPESDVLSIVDKANQEIGGGPRIQHIKEPEIGLSRARNTGAQRASGDVVVYIGDDVLVHPGWLKAILEPFNDSKVACVGGKLIAKWEAPIPEWFSQLKHMALGMLDLGEKTLVLKGAQIWGDNMAVRKTVLLEVGGFPPDIYGYGDRNLLWFSGDGECGLEKEILKRKYVLIYEPKAWVYHRVSASRTKEEYFYKRSFVLAIGSSFGQVRSMRSKNFLQVRLFLQSTFYFLRSIMLFLAARLKRENRIQTGTFAYRYYGKAHHQFRAAFSKKLRNHIFQESYLEKGK